MTSPYPNLLALKQTIAVPAVSKLMSERPWSIVSVNLGYSINVHRVGLAQSVACPPLVR